MQPVCKALALHPVLHAPLCRRAPGCPAWAAPPGPPPPAQRQPRHQRRRQQRRGRCRAGTWRRPPRPAGMIWILWWRTSCRAAERPSPSRRPCDHGRVRGGGCSERQWTVLPPPPPLAFHGAPGRRGWEQLQRCCMGFPAGPAPSLAASISRPPLNAPFRWQCCWRQAPQRHEAWGVQAGGAEAAAGRRLVASCRGARRHVTSLP